VSEFSGVLIKTSDKAYLFKVSDREVWVPRSVIKSCTKFAPDAEGHRECIVNVEEWFAEKKDL